MSLLRNCHIKTIVMLSFEEQSEYYNYFKGGNIVRYS